MMDIRVLNKHALMELRKWSATFRISIFLIIFTGNIWFFKHYRIYHTITRASFSTAVLRTQSLAVESSERNIPTKTDVREPSYGDLAIRTGKESEDLVK